MKSFVYCFFVCLTLVSGVQASAQTNRSFRKGYRGDVELGNYATFGKDEAGGMILFTSTHGYSMGNGMFIGGGAGYGYEIASDLYLVSAFIDAKYNLKDAAVSPFLAARTGAFLGGGRSQYTAQFVSLSCGVDVSRLSVKIGYQYAPVRQEVAQMVIFNKPSRLYCSFAICF